MLSCSKLFKLKFYNFFQVARLEGLKVDLAERKHSYFSSPEVIMACLCWLRNRGAGKQLPHSRIRIELRKGAPSGAPLADTELLPVNVYRVLKSPLNRELSSRILKKWRFKNINSTPGRCTFS